MLPLIIGAGAKDEAPDEAPEAQDGAEVIEATATRPS